MAKPARILQVKKLKDCESDPQGNQTVVYQTHNPDDETRAEISESVFGGLYDEFGELNENVQAMVRESMGVSKSAKIRLKPGESITFAKCNYNGINGKFIAEVDGNFEVVLTEEEALERRKLRDLGIEPSERQEEKQFDLLEQAEVDISRLHSKGWFNDEQEKLVKIKTLAPFLFGQVYQPDIWIKYLYEVDLLPSCTPTSVDALDEKNLHIVDVVEQILTIIIKEMKEDFQRVKKLNALFEDIDNSVFSSRPKKPTERPLTEILDRSKQDFLHSWKDELKEAMKSKNKTTTLNDRQIAVAILFSCRQYVNNAYKVTESLKIVDEFKKILEENDKKIQEKKDQGNENFNSGSYIQASQLYTQAIYISPFNHILYGNRAQAYLYSGSFKAALTDAKRAIILEPHWHKGYYRCAQAYWDLGNKKEAYTEIENGLKNCPGDNKNLVDQRKKFSDEDNKIGTGTTVSSDATNNIDQSSGDISPPISNESSGDISPPIKNENVPDYDTAEEAIESDIDDNEDDDDNNDNDEDDGCPGLTSSSEDSDIPSLVEETDSESETDSQKFKSNAKTPGEIEEERRKYLEKERRLIVLEEERKLQKKLAEKKIQDDIKRKKKEDEKKEKQRKRAEKDHQKEVIMKGQRKEDRQSELYESLKQGSEALLDSRQQNAMYFYEKCLNAIEEFTIEYFPQFGDLDLVLLKYSIGTSSMEMGTSKDIQRAIGWYKEIMDKHHTIRFPLVFIGLGRAFYKLSRFDKALCHVDEGLVVVVTAHHGVVTKCTWPGTTTVIEETQPGYLKIALEDLKVQCSNPPKPDATCRYLKCQYRIQIYVTDPEHKGFVRIMCYAKCIVEYHLECWRKFKKDRLSQSDKDYLNCPCFTPDCSSKISTILTFDQYGSLVKELDIPEPEKVDKVKTIPMKMKPSSQHTISRRAEQKRNRQLKREEIRRIKELGVQGDKNVTDIIDRMTVSVNNNTANNEQATDVAGTVLDIQVNERCVENGGGDGQVNMKKYMTVLKKENESEEQKQEIRGVKLKSRKKHRSKITMSLDQFVGPRDTIDPLGNSTSTMDCMDDFNDDPNDPFAVPQHLKQEVDMFDSLYDVQNLPRRGSLTDGKTADIKDTLFSFFVGVLSEHGPLQKDDIIITRELEDFPAEAHDIIAKTGGIDKFLLQSLQFAVIDNFVCLLQDTVKARKLAEIDKNPLGIAGGCVPLLQTPESNLMDKQIKNKMSPKPTTINNMDNMNNKLDELDTFTSESTTNTSKVVSSSGHSITINTIASSIIDQMQTSNQNTTMTMPFNRGNAETNTSPARPKNLVITHSVEESLPPEHNQNKSLSVDKNQNVDNLPLSEKRSKAQVIELEKGKLKDKQSNSSINNVKKVANNQTKKTKVVENIENSKKGLNKINTAEVIKETFRKQVASVAAAESKGKKQQQKAGKNSPKKQSTPVKDTENQSNKGSKSKNNENKVHNNTSGKTKKSEAKNDTIILEHSPSQMEFDTDDLNSLDDGKISDLDIINSMNNKITNSLTSGDHKLSDKSELGIKHDGMVNVVFETSSNSTPVHIKTPFDDLESPDKCQSLPTTPARSLYNWVNPNSKPGERESNLKWSQNAEQGGDNQKWINQNANSHEGSEKSEVENDMWDSMTINDLKFPLDKPQDQELNWGSAQLKWDNIINTHNVYDKIGKDFIVESRASDQNGPSPTGPLNTVELDGGVLENNSLSSRFGPIGSNKSRTESPAHGSSSLASSVSVTPPIHTPKFEGILPPFPSVHNSDTFPIIGNDIIAAGKSNSFPSLQSDDRFITHTFGITPPNLTNCSDIDKFNDETFGIPTDLTETSEEYIPDDEIKTVVNHAQNYFPPHSSESTSPRTGLFINDPVWSSPFDKASFSQNNFVEDEQLANSDNQIAIEQTEIDKTDHDFVNEMADSVFRSICNNEPFKSNPMLRENIKADIRKDIARSELNKRIESITTTTTNIVPIPLIKKQNSSGHTKKVKTCHIACQFDPSEFQRDASCNTDKYEPQKEELLKTKEDLDVTNMRLHELLDKHTQYLNSTGTELKSLRSLVDALEQECKGLRKERNKAVEDRDLENRKWTNEKKILSEEVKTLKKDTKNSKFREEHLTSQLYEVQHKLVELNETIGKERETVISERQLYVREKNEVQEKYSTQLSRAETAEVKFLQLKVEVGSQILDRSLKDAEMYANQFSSFVQGLRDNNQPVPPQIVMSCDQWKHTAQSIRDIKAKSMEEFEDQIRMVRQGTPLDRLPNLQIPRPPPPPENPVAMMNALMRGGIPVRGTPSVGAPTGITKAIVGSTNTTPPAPPPGLLPPGVQTNRPTNAQKISLGANRIGFHQPSQGSSPGFSPQIRPPGHNIQKSSKSAFEKVIEMLQAMFPSHSRTDLSIMIQDLRSSRNGSLSGMSLEQIVRKVADIIITDQKRKMSMGGITRAPPAFVSPVTSHVMSNNMIPRSNTPNNITGTEIADEIFQEEEDPCIICHDELTFVNSVKLECSHRYHTECIRKWFREQSTCPTCRVHALLPDDFPSLG